ncbi:MAG TPA: glycosyltransferase family 4 protein [Xanthobacteraceae bacterium]
MKRFVFAVPGDLGTPTGGYAYDRRVVAELTLLEWDVQVADIGGDFPRPSAAMLAAARAQLLAVPTGVPIVADGLAFGVLPELAAELHRDHPLIALVHHPLALETGITPAEAEAFRRSERAALAHTDRVIATSPSTARRLCEDYGVVAARITVALPGSEPRPPAPRRPGNTVRLLAVGSLVRRKGYDVLVAALAQVTDLPWRLTIAGDHTRSPTTTAALDADIHRLGLDGRIALMGAVSDDELEALHAGADLFVLASRFEGYGMAFAAAIAHGLPVIGTTGGAIPETVPAGAGVLVPPDDVDALAAALRRLIGDAAARERFAAAARDAAARLPTWRQSAELFAHAIEAAQ